MKISKLPTLWRYYLLSTKYFGVKLHWVREVEDEWHTHPWNGFSIIFGHYEEQLEKDGPWRKVWFFNRIGANKPHRTRGNVYTLFFHGPRINENWYWGEKEAPWRGVQNYGS